jgi:hypothetical protein
MKQKTSQHGDVIENPHGPKVRVVFGGLRGSDGRMTVRNPTTGQALVRFTSGPLAGRARWMHENELQGRGFNAWLRGLTF